MTKSLVLVGMLLALGAQAQHLGLPARPADSPGGSTFGREVTDLRLEAREERILREIRAGNVPDFLRNFRQVNVTNESAVATNRLTFYVAPDYLAVGSETDYLLCPVSPNTAQKIADLCGCALPTRKMVDAIYAAADLKLEPMPIPPSPSMTSMAVFLEHNAMVWTQRVAWLKTFPLGVLVAGHKKDIVVTPRLASAPGKVAIYGWQRTNGLPIQPLYLGHTAAWVDYSQCTRLVSQRVELNGQIRRLSEVLSDPQLAGLVSDEGAFDARYSTNGLIEAGATNRITGSAQLKPGRPGELVSTGNFGERVAEFRYEPQIRVVINAPATNATTARQPITLLFYALPNGNTIEQTIGQRLHPGDDWHYDIQHIGAQTRFLRARFPGRSLVVVYLENELRSWPAWRKKYPDTAIPGILKAVEGYFANSEFDIVLSGHSGGGSLIFGYLNAVPAIPANVRRIAFLDANYAYDATLGHARKLATWLSAASDHYLCVLAYNDAAALLDGKSFVSAAGGTWGKSLEMQRDLERDFAFTRNNDSEFQRFSALDGRIQFLLKENPDRKVLHTVQVERNGFIHAMVTGTPEAEQGYRYFGSRAYSEWIVDKAKQGGE